MKTRLPFLLIPFQPPVGHLQAKTTFGSLQNNRQLADSHGQTRSLWQSSWEYKACREAAPSTCQSAEIVKPGHRVRFSLWNTRVTSSSHRGSTLSLLLPQSSQSSDNHDGASWPPSGREPHFIWGFLGQAGCSGHKATLSSFH